ncbi:hypothetical protein K491DRAFT_606887 [Lophiostoma macrostomum CBS 122681]|uniref:Uncharacterized protein n=1 Tax=Lophiostoma macrostomum CBS 122681 TaxID=1314788 RepID=A0A6A6SUI9_9PLEO|nr:hypothetical protein K491DRAFT_606887 [Lophiostoma macrostomum CBS 122681]
MSSGLNATGGTEQFRGWVPQSNDRGTLDIIISCGATIFLCIWTSVCVNVPHPADGAWAIFRDRCYMFILGAIGPEAVYLLAIGQWCSARASVRAFSRSRYPGWTMKHAFFADMGAIHLKVEEMDSFPVNAKQLHFLVINKYIPYPHIPREVIDDKNKYDGLARLISTVQIFWFTLNTVARVITGIATTTLEITTVGFIVCTLPTLFFWRHKPMNVQFPIELACDVPLHQIVGPRGRNAAKPYHSTPLDFIGIDDWSIYQAWRFYVSLLRKMRLVPAKPASLPKRRISSFNFPPLTIGTIAVAAVTLATYTSVFVAAWNLHFATHVEQVLWRVTTLGSMVTAAVGPLFEGYFILPKFLSRRRVSRTHKPHEPGNETDNFELVGRSTFHYDSNEPQTLSECTPSDAEAQGHHHGHVPKLPVPLRTVLVSTPVLGLYVIFRMYILVEDAISLRRLPESAYAGIDWTQVIPHI